MDKVAQKSEIIENKLKGEHKRLGSNGPVVILKPVEVDQKKISEDGNKEDKDIRYKEISAVKLGCNKCLDVFYSKGGYNAHLFMKHRIRNVSRHPPTVINKFWTKIPERDPLVEGQHECEICAARFFDLTNFLNHINTCRQKTVEEEEERKYELYRMMERDEKERADIKINVECGEVQKDESDEVIEPTQPKKQCHSRSRRQSLSLPKKRRRNTSSISQQRCKVYVKEKVDLNDLSKSGDKMENVEFYKNVLNKYKTDDKAKPKDPKGTHESSPTNLTLSAESRHAPDTDFEVSHATPTANEASTEDSLPSISIPRTRYQLHSRNICSQPKDVKNDSKPKEDEGQEEEKDEYEEVDSADKKSEISENIELDGDGSNSKGK